MAQYIQGVTGKHGLSETIALFSSYFPLSIGCPACTQALNPPRIGVTLEKPLSISICAARALDSSAGQVQYGMIHEPGLSSPVRLGSSLSGIDNAPVM